MSRDTLATVAKVRKSGVEAARAAVAEAIRATDRADAAVRAWERGIDDERRRASDPSGGDDLVEAFAAWLPEARRSLAAACTEQERRSAELARCRAELTRTEVALETIQTLLRQRANEATVAELGRGQRMIDEMAARPRVKPP